MSDRTPPESTRWRPTRAGILNIWEYDDQVFEFAEGRLVLRGPNGSGKSNALALLVPFLLDGVMAANRMDSISGGRSMKTLLLCLNDDERANRFRHEQRTGYVWLEFECDGAYLTIGCGARASTQRDAEAWFFVTEQRSGAELDLAPGGVPLSRGALVERLGASAVHDSAESYRAAVDRRLFGLGAQRYRNLIELLLVLRRPHLAGKLNLEHLSKVLSDGLAALDEDLIASVAASFEDLEAVQRDLRRLQDAHRTVQTFLPVYRRYLRAVGRVRAIDATQAERALRSAHRRVADAGTRVDEADAAVERVRLDRHACNQRQEIAEQRQRAVLESPAYRDALSLAEVEGRANDAADASTNAAERLKSAEEDAQEAERHHAIADDDLRAATTRVYQSFDAVTHSADQAGVPWSTARGELDTAPVQQIVRGLARQRRDDVAQVRAALGQAEVLAGQAATASEAAARVTETAEQAEVDREAAATDVDDARAALGEAVRRWVDENDIDGLHAVLVATELVGEPDAPTLSDVLTEALRPHYEGLTTRETRVDIREIEVSEHHAALLAERDRLASERLLAPDRLLTRPADRRARAGAPFYACVDFHESVPEGDRAGLEAAIEAAGLLDAWVGERTDDLDAWLERSNFVDGPSLADVLVATPRDGSQLDEAHVLGVLRSIALADVGVGVLPDGRFHLGPLRGRFAKPNAEFIGAEAREQRRQRLLADLDQQVADATAEMNDIEAERMRLADRRSHLDEVATSLPSSSALLEARELLLAAVATAKSTRAAATRAEESAREARRATERAEAALRRLAADRRLPMTRPGLDESEQSVHAFEQQANDLVAEVSRLADSRFAAERSAERLARNEERVAKCREDAEELERRASGLGARVAQLRRQLGPEAEVPLRELEGIEGELGELRAEMKRLDEENTRVAEQRGAALREQELAAEGVGERVAAAVAAAARLDVLRRSDVWPNVVSDEPEPPIGASEVASSVVRATSDVSGEPDDNALQRAYRQLLDDLGRGYDPGLSYVDHVAVVEVTSDAGTFSVLWLGDELTEQVARQEALLSERDREIFERHLLTRVSESLRELLNDAHELVHHINESLADRPTASGKSVQLRWEPDTGDAVVREALGLLRRSPELLGPEEREQLRWFFSTAIAQRRAEDAALGYEEVLRQVLDYRSWHAFVPHIRSASGGTQRLTRTLFRSLSGGEQAVVLHLPLFAAAAAHYDIAADHAPRLIALDEAFAGIDEGMRAELMGLLVRFDLDVVLTGHELWGAYEQVPAVMIYDLLRHPPLEGVSAFAVRWDGAAMAEA